MLNNIPAEMRVYRQWIIWRLELREGQKPTKVPYQPWPNGRKASVTNPDDWGTFEQASSAPFSCVEPVAPETPISETGYSGVGFVFTLDDPFTGIDLDNTHGDTEAYNRQLKIFREFQSYSELSPSGEGLHIIIKGKIPHGRRRASIELYSNERYFTMTGNVQLQAPIMERQDLLNILFEQMGGAAEVHSYGEDQEQKATDDEILAQALNATNGDKFQRLLLGDWEGLYPSQSEADFAFVDIIAFYTQNKQQIRRIFRASALGQTPKDNYEHRGDRAAYVEYMVGKSFDRQLPPLDLDGVKIQLEKHVGNSKKKLAADEAGSTTPAANTEAAHAMACPEPTGTLHTGPSTSHAAPQPVKAFPPGLLGDVAQFILDQAPRPVPEIALAGAIGLLSGITGRAYNVSGTGLNQYLLLIAKTGRGKEAIASGISKLMKAVQASVPAAADFIGPTAIASSPGLLKWMAEKPCIYSVVGEFGYKLKEMSSLTANVNTTAIMGTLLDLYNKSGKGNVVGSSAYSDKANNTHVVNSPSFTLIGESTPSKLYENINESMVSDGLLPRFIVMDYTGPRVEFNENHKNVEPPFKLVEAVAALVAQCLTLAHNGTVYEVPIEDKAKKVFDDFNTFCDAQINDEKLGEVAHELWNRAHIKSLKLAALFAVGWNYINPWIYESMAVEATNMIAQQIHALKGRFDRGEVGGGAVNGAANDGAQMEMFCKLIGEWISGPHSAIEKYRVREDMHKDRVYPFSSLLIRMANIAIFKNDRQGGNAAVKRAYDVLIDNGDLAELNKNQAHMKYGKRAKMFCILNPDRFLT